MIRRLTITMLAVSLLAAACSSENSSDDVVPQPTVTASVDDVVSVDGDGVDDGDENMDLNGDGIVDFLQPAELLWKTATMGSIGPLSFWEFALLLITVGTLWFVRRRNGHPT